MAPIIEGVDAHRAAAAGARTAARARSAAKTRRAARVAALAAALLGCGKREPKQAEPMPGSARAAGEEGRDGGDGGVAAAAPSDAGAAPWPELEGLPRAEPERVVLLPAKPDLPRFSVGGPVIAGDVAVVASSQFGFLGVDWRRGAIAWSRPSGLHVAPPVAVEGGVALVGECFSPPAIAAGERLLGCLRVVSPTGADQAYMAIRGAAAATEPFAAEPGPQALWRASERSLRWRRGEQAVSIDLITGVATPAAPAPPPLAVAYRDRRWEIEQDDGHIIARKPAARGPGPGPVAWRTENRYTAILGTVWQPDSAPMLRIAAPGRGGGAVIRVIDMDATGSLATANARPMPGLSLLGWSASPVGDVALAIRLDASLRRDFIAGYAASAMVMWVYPLPEQPRVDPVGVAVAPDAVLVFHDGDTLTILPELSTPPTAPGAPRAPSQNPTP